MASNAPVIVIVGGVAAGASAATRARRVNENATIILLEKDGYISFANCGLPYYIGGEIQNRDDLLVTTPQALHARYRIDVRVWNQVNAIDPGSKTIKVHDRAKDQSYDLSYDKLILAMGAGPITPPIQGIDSINVFSLRNLHDTDAIRDYASSDNVKHVTVVGAGYIGLEMVEMFKHMGKQVSLVEMLDQVLAPLDKEMADQVQDELVNKQIDLHIGDALAGFGTRGDAVSQVQLKSGKAIDTDMVLMGVGVRPSVQMAVDAGVELGATGGIKVDQHQRTSVPDIYAAGDAVEYRHAVTDQWMRVPLAGPANRAGRLAGEHAATGKSAAMPAVLGTSIVRVFDLAAGGTGLNAKMASKQGIAFRTVYVAGKHHVGYYPGAQGMMLKMLYSPASRRVLGFQAVGGAGIDKRIDVMATAIQMKATVDDLTGLDLAYAPPFGHAKDPLHMLGFAACNELDGLVTFEDPATPLDGQQVVDVRPPEDYAQLKCTAATNIPLAQLRDRLKELDPDKPVLVTCRSGQGAYVGARILSQHGFKDVADVAGGALIRRKFFPDMFE